MTARWRGYSHPELYKMINSGPGPAASEAQTAYWQSLTKELEEVDADLNKALSDLKATWQGSAADSATTGMTPLQAWASDAQSGSTVMRISSEDQADYISSARAEMPKPVEVTTPAPSAWDVAGAGASAIFGNPVPAAMVALQAADHERQEAAQNAAADKAVDTMNSYQASSTWNRNTLGTFSAPPDVVVATPPPAGAATSGGEIGAWMRDGTYSVPSGNTTTTSSFTTNGGGQSGGGSSTPPVPPGSGGGAPVPSGVGSGASFGPSGTNPSGYLPPPAPGPMPTPTPPGPPPGPPGVPPVGGFPGNVPISGSLPGNLPGDTERTGNPTGGRGVPGGFGPDGRGGAGGTGGLGSGGSGSQQLGRGATPGLAAAGGEGVLGRGGAAQAGAPVRGGAAGMGGGPMGAGGRGTGDEDEEHFAPDYLLETTDVFGDDRMVSPAVIGENPTEDEK